MRHIVSIACTGHGASISYLGADGTVRSSVLDRWAGTKNTLMFSADEDREIRNPTSDMDRGIRDLLVYGFGKFPRTMIFEETVHPWLEWLVGDLGIRPADIDLLVTSDSHFAVHPLRLGRKLSRWFPRARIVRAIEHHQVHQRQAFWQSGFSEAAVLTLDTCGEELDRLGGKKLSGTISAMNSRGECTVLSEMTFPESSAGIIYDSANRHVGFRQGDEGKTMGLAPYGGPEFFDRVVDRLRLYDDGHFLFMSDQEFKDCMRDYVPERSPGDEMTERHMNVAYAAQAIMNLIVTNAFKAAHRLTCLPDLVFAGGIALNSVANEIARKEAGTRRLYMATNPGDTGHALGLALFGAYELAGWTPTGRELPEYLGPPYTEAQVRDAMGDLPHIAPPDLAEVVARMIANGYIVARFDGGAEFGPRALGNRSILCDARWPDMQDYLNLRVKHREEFRPFAPTVLEEEAPHWFELEDRSAYMLRVVPVRPEAKERVPAIVHVDGSARVQTLSQSENPGYRQIIEAFYKLTGVPLLLNTSFNLGGKPIVETPADAVACFTETLIDGLIMGPYLLTKLPPEEYLREPRAPLAGVELPAL
ncbi:MAG: hypothetical protein M3441_01670 [Chloroflexota bacterium]|nr:hypothetical protein [Chloroflexota bacterium]